jgi:hypothetical protein
MATHASMLSHRHEYMQSQQCAAKFANALDNDVFSTVVALSQGAKRGAAHKRDRHDAGHDFIGGSYYQPGEFLMKLYQQVCQSGRHERENRCTAPQSPHFLCSLTAHLFGKSDHKRVQSSTGDTDE